MMQHLPNLALALLLATGCGDSSDSSSTGGEGGSAGSGGAQDAGIDVSDSGEDQTTQDASPDSDIPDSDIPQDASSDGETDAEPIPYTSMGTLTVDCNVPFVLDASKVTNMAYMTSHFGDLVQQYGITGVIGGQDITAFPEKMYYGAHMPADLEPKDLLSLVQISMASITQPTFSVRVDFKPDTAVTTGATWTVGLEDGQAVAAMFKHESSSELCLMSMGYGGQLTFQHAKDTTQVEGGTFHVVGTMNMVVPDEIPELCDIAAQINTPCCQ